MVVAKDLHTPAEHRVSVMACGCCSTPAKVCVALRACDMVVLNAAVVMKISKKGKGPQQIWIPLERLWFDKNQRVQVRHCLGPENGMLCTLHCTVMVWLLA